MANKDLKSKAPTHPRNTRYIKNIVGNLTFKILIEGPDGTGKSLLADTFAQLYEAEVMHQTSDTINNKAYYQNILGSPNNIVLDRTFFGDVVYNTPLRLSENDKKELIDMYNGSNAMLIYVTCEPNVARTRLEARGEVLPENFERLFKAEERLFLEQFNRWRLKPLVIDTSHMIEMVNVSDEVHPSSIKGLTLNQEAVNGDFDDVPPYTKEATQ